MSTRRKISLFIYAVLLAFIFACRASKGIADFYSLSIYPTLSAILSFIASIVPFSLMEIVVVIAIIALIWIPATAKRHHRRWTGVLARQAEVLLIIYVWFYMAWGINYFRSSIFERAQTSPARVEKTAFTDFLENYTRSLNDSYTDNIQVDSVELERHVKDFYSSLDKKYGLSKPKAYQHPKKQIFSALQAGCGVMGYIGPAFTESHIGHSTPTLQYPHTYAHEYSHVLGVSNEAEANYWAYKACMASDIPAVRYSAIYALLGHVAANARRILSEEEYAQWISEIRPEVLQDEEELSQYWSSIRWNLLDKIQTYVYGLFLKSNRIPNGLQNYSEVVLILMSLENGQV